MELTLDALVNLVHRYYPAGIEEYDPRYQTSEEAQRLKALLETHVGGIPAWNAFVQRLREEFVTCSIWDMTVPRHDPGYIVRVSLPGFVSSAPLQEGVVCLLSKLAPVYALYASHLKENGPGLPRDHWIRFPPFPPEFQAHEARLAEFIESTFAFVRLPEEVLLTPVPDLVPWTGKHGLGQARLMDLLFTEYPG
jgi:hypothetical protein